MDDRLITFEVKASADIDDVNMFALKTDLLALQNPEQRVHGVFVLLAADEEIRRQCVDMGVELVDALEE